MPLHLLLRKCNVAMCKRVHALQLRETGWGEEGFELAHRDRAERWGLMRQWSVWQGRAVFQPAKHWSAVSLK